jgi:glycosyltransferase involved in cell wall biosynthesis
MTQRIKLLLAIPHLGGGGAERVFAQLARHLNPSIFEIHLALITEDASGAIEPPQWVTVHRFHPGRVRKAAPQLLAIIRTLKPHIVLSGMAHLNFLLLLLKPLLPSETRILVRQNTTASSAAHTALSRLLYRTLYPRADLVLCQSQAMAADLIRHFAIAPDKLSVLNNPIDFPRQSMSVRATGVRTLLAVGRLSPEKGLDLLLEALVNVRAVHPHVKLTILGVGAEQTKLKALTIVLGLSNCVEFAGHADPTQYYMRSILFVLPSRYEGMPNALLEAAAAGLPIVATPCSDGLSELLQEAPGAWISAAITAEALASSILTALDTLAAQSVQRYEHAFVATFKTKTAITAYEQVLIRQARRHIAMVIPTIDQIGGAERQVLLLAKALAARQWRVSVIALSGNAVEQGSFLAAASVQFVPLGMRKAWIDPKGWFRYLHWARINKPEILHSHLPHATYFARAVRLFRWMTLALVVPNCAVIDTIHTSQPGPVSRRRAYRLTAWLSDQLTCVSQAVAESVLNAGITSEIAVIPNGIELPEPNWHAVHMEPKTPSSPFRWIAVGRLAPVKDYPTLLRAFAAIERPAQLTILGTGPDELSLRKLTTELDIEDRLRFAGFQADVQPWLGSADAFVLSSLWEGLPVAVLEASAAGLPVVATDGSGTSAAILPKRSGLLVPVGDSVALTAAMTRVMSMPDAERKAMGTAGRQFVEQHYSLAGVIGKWETLYQTLIEKPSR